MNIFFGGLLSLALSIFGSGALIGNHATSPAPHMTTAVATPAPTPTPYHPGHFGPYGDPTGGAGGGHETCPAGWYLTASGQCELVTY